MSIFKSIFKRKLTTFFFIIAYTLAILSFSLGNSVIEQQKLKAQYLNSENNKILSFNNCSNFNLLDLERLLKNDNITLDVYKNINLNKSESFNLSTSLINNGLRPFINMRDGDYFSKEDFESNSHNAIFSSTIDVSDFKYSFKIYNSDETYREVLLIQKGLTTEREKKIIVPRKIFLENVENINLNESDLLIKINGDQEEIRIALDRIENTIKEYNVDAQLTISPYIVDDTSEEYQYLFKVSFVIILIILLNSINISSLWMENRKKEIILRKVFGATNKDIFNILFSELTVIASLSLILAFLVQTVLYRIFNGNILDINIYLYKSNFVYALILALVTSYISALPVYIYLLKIQPARLLSEE